MRHLSILTFAVLLLSSAALPSRAQAPSSTAYSIDIDQNHVFRVSREDETGQKALFVTVQFQIHLADGSKDAVVPKDSEEYIVVKENGQVVKKLKLTQLKTQALTTVLVLDHSGSMRKPANDTDTVSKIAAARAAATRFVELMPPRAQTTLLPFSSTIGVPAPFSADKQTLEAHIGKLTPDGGTLLYDATYAGIETLAAAHPEGTKVVVVMTDGKDEDPGSRHSPNDLIERARAANVKLYMLGFGRQREINETVMRDLAEQTGGQYYQAENQQKLFELFDRLATELQTNYTVTFPSRNPSNDGTARGIDISIVNSAGETVSNVAQTDYGVHGVVVAQRDSTIYLSLLALLCGLLLVPTGLRKMYRALGGT